MNDSLVSRCACALVASLMLTSCAPGSTSGAMAPPDVDSERTFYEPGMGDLMSALQLRHAKLWYAAQAENWALAAFELHEIDETFERIERWHPEEDGVPVAPALKGYMRAAHEALETSVTNSDTSAFEAAFDRFTEGCNACHQAMKHEFIAIQRPTREPVSNQRWEVKP